MARDLDAHHNALIRKQQEITRLRECGQSLQAAATKAQRKLNELQASDPFLYKVDAPRRLPEIADLRSRADQAMHEADAISARLTAEWKDRPEFKIPDGPTPQTADTVLEAARRRQRERNHDEREIER